jgi:enolase-phosphatase E1
MFRFHAILVFGTYKTIIHILLNSQGLKSLQGKIWKSGYTSGELKGHVYEDFKPMLDWCKDMDVSVNIYSSGSIGAQKLLFGYSTEGDLCEYFQNHFDTTSGGKKESQSYKNISNSAGMDVKDICFVSDSEAELNAAREAGIGHVVMSVRPGNAPMTNRSKDFPVVFSLLQLCGSGK